MSKEFLEGLQYDSCVSRGICSIGPITSALQSALIMYLKFIAKNITNYDEESLEYKYLKDLVLNLFPIAVCYPEFTENSFKLALYEFHRIVNLFDDKNEILENGRNLFEATKDIVHSIRYGEKVFLQAQENLSSEIRDLYNIMLVIAKSIAINLSDLESYKYEQSEGFAIIIDILNEINLEEKNIEVLKEKIFRASKIDNMIMSRIRFLQEKRYGLQKQTEVSFSTKPSKAVLVVGSNIRELENVLDKLSEEAIDVYTHDEMMIAHTFPKFLNYENLRGQFGSGLENCLLDFATFPGPIILTKHSLHNIDNLYRGRLFTTDFTCPKGVIRIIDNNFSDVIKSAKNAKGFKTGKLCESINIGCNYEESISYIKTRINNQKNIFLIALDSYSLEQKNYFEKLFKLVSDDILVISFSYNSASENIIHLNTCFDTFGLIKIFEAIKDCGIPITVFLPQCDKNSVSQMVYLKSFENVEVFVGRCTPILLNPSLISTLQKLFSIKSISSAKKDLETILKD